MSAILAALAVIAVIVTKWFMKTTGAVTVKGVKIVASASLAPRVMNVIHLRITIGAENVNVVVNVAVVGKMISMIW